MSEYYYDECKYCLRNSGCPYEKFSYECQSYRDICEFCSNHCQYDSLFELDRTDAGYSFDRISDIKYCPICGRELQLD